MTANAMSRKKPIVHQTVRIEKFEELMNSDESSHHGSEWISSEPVPQASWKLSVDIDRERIGNTEKRSSNISIYLWLAGQMVDGEENFYGSYHLYLIDGSGSKIDVKRCSSHNFGKRELAGECVSHEQVKKALHADGSLMVAADVWFPVHNVYIDYTSIKIAEKRALHTKWHNSVDKLRESGDYSDCTLKVGGKELKAHRFILSAISPIFGKMFSKEAKNGIVRIEDPPGMLKDSTAKPYKALLSYAYTGSVDWSIFGDCKGDVLVLACKYLVLDLKHHVEGQLAREITTENFTELALLADTYSCDKLKKACIEFFSFVYAAVMRTPQWDALMEKRVDLANELLQLVREDETTATDRGG